MDKVTLHILYGIPCAGKSTLALRYASQHSIRTVIHTDYVREVQRTFAPHKKQSALMKVSHNAWELFGGPSPENIVRGFQAHADVVSPAILAIARKLSKDGFDAIIEGAHFYSPILDQLASVDNLVLKPQLLTVSSKEVLAARIASKESGRAHSGEAKAWAERIDIMLEIQNFLVQDAMEHNIPII